jgi:hypothetical protein
MTDTPDLFTPAPYVADSDTSRSRAQHEDSTGITTARQRSILAHLLDNPAGLNWRELGTLLNLHHGQISGALSVMHRDGRVYQLTTKRHNCHVYIHPDYEGMHTGKVVYEPVQTFATKERLAMEAVVDAARTFARTGLGLGNVVNAINALDTVRGNK